MHDADCVERSTRRISFQRSTVLWSAVVAAVAVLAGLLAFQHRELHATNGCVMTYIYRAILMRPIDVPDNKIYRYRLFRYMEGRVDQTVRPSDIPVLFVPGSGGSANQVRSMASVMGNKTEMRAAPFRFVFYAIDFDEELSFLSGRTLERQRDYVIQCMQVISRIHANARAAKIVLVGHSFGGTLLYALPAHPLVNVAQMELVITLGAPLRAPPIPSDAAMEQFYASATETWRRGDKILDHISFLSYSGGLKDALIPDYLAANPITGTETVTHLPSWSLPDVALEADHLCILWCNSLVRHTTRILYAYGEMWTTKRPVDIATEVTSSFYKPYKTRWQKELSAAAAVDNEDILLSWTTPFLGARIRIEKSRVTLRAAAWTGAVWKVDVLPAGQCSEGPIISFRSSAENHSVYGGSGESSIRIGVSLPESEQLAGVLRLRRTAKQSDECQHYEIYVTMDIAATVYKLSLLNIRLLPLSIFFCLLVLASAATLPTVPSRSRIVFNIMTLSFLIFFGRSHLPLILLTTSISTTATIVVGTPVMSAARKISSLRVTKRIHSLLILSISVILLALSVKSVYFAFGGLLLVYALKFAARSRAAVSLLLYSSAAAISIGLAGGIRDTPKNASLVDSDALVTSSTLGEAARSIHSLAPIFMALFSFFASGAGDSESLRDLSPVSIGLLLLRLRDVTTMESVAVVAGYAAIMLELRLPKTTEDSDRQIDKPSDK